MSNATLSLSYSSSTAYSQNDVAALTDDQNYRRSQLRQHYQDCQRCWNLAQSGRDRYDSEGCSTAVQLAEVVIDLDLELGHWPAIHRYGLSWYYENSYGFHAHEPITEAMGTVVTSSEQVIDRWATEPDAQDDWTAEDVLRAARDTTPPATMDELMAAERARRLVTKALSDAETPWELYTLTTDVDVEGLLKAHARIWTTPRGEVGIYKTFISNVTAEYFTAYCSVCRKRLVMERSLRNVIATILHAHTHLPNSVVRGDTQEESTYLTLEGSEATPLPGMSTDADKAFVAQAGRWYIDTALVEYRESRTPLDEVTQAWIDWLKTL